MLHGGSLSVHPTTPPLLGERRSLQSHLPVRVFVRNLCIRAAVMPAMPDDFSPPPSSPQRREQQVGGANAGASSPQNSTEWRVYAKKKWKKDNESALSKDEPLPLPMGYPGSAPSSQELEDMKNCDPTLKDCKDVLYQWTGQCSRCQGTGEVSFYRKRGREVISKCISCLGLGDFSCSVWKFSQAIFLVAETGKLRLRSYPLMIS